ncbi:MAG TPA: 2-oxoacid:acceptor oxidoreductase family protein [Anaerolineales bacterium]|nr:2-oxoacid:acceptor oxidoreductase family protein [Anaerolineales bacterium]
METQLIISGFGGQGALFAGTLLAYAAMENGRQVSWIPSYGPEMRGGTAHCTVIISDDEIGSPVVRNPSAAIVMNLPSLDRYEPVIQPNGVLIVNSSLVDREPSRSDLRWRMVPANAIAEELGDRRMANMVLLGAYLAVEPIFTLEQIEESLARHIPSHRRGLLESNYQALRQGFEAARAAVAA